MKYAVATLAALLVGAPITAAAEPGLAGEVYGPGVTRGETELELRAGYLTGGVGDGEYAAIAEASYGVTDWWRPALLVEVEREPGADAKVEAVAIENVFDFTATRKWPVHFGGYLEYEANAQDGADKIELKILAERARGPLLLRANIIAEHEVGGGADNAWEYGYATQGMWAVNDDFALGVEGFGDFGTDAGFGRLSERAYYWGPVVKFEAFETTRGELEAHIGYLFGFGDAEADGQIRLILEWER